MKFDFVIGNPPYQETKEGTSDKPVYNEFMDAANTIATKVELITPARFLFNAGKTPKSWNQKMLSDPHFKVQYYQQDSSIVFPNTDIKGGIAITYRDAERSFGEIGTFTVYDELNTILQKTIHKRDFSSFNQLIYAPESYRLSKKLHEDIPDAITHLSKGHLYDVTTNIFDRLDFLFSEEKPDGDERFIQILGRKNNQRVYMWIKENYIDPHPNLSKYKVILPKSNGSGALGETLSNPMIGIPFVGHTQSFISIGAFDSEFEASAVLKYIKSKFVRTMLGTLKVTQDNKKAAWANVPIQDFTPNSDIDWSGSVADIDRQLYRKYGLSEDEISFIEEKVKEMV